MNHNITKNFILNIIPEIPVFAMILGSGLGEINSIIDKKIHIPYSDIPNHPQTSIKGHAGEWVFGYINEHPIIFASGRFHYYEGFSIEEVTTTVSIIYELGCQNLFITNAAGCLNLKWNLGDFMLINGYIDYTFRKNSNIPETTLINDNFLYKKVIKTLIKSDLKIRQGIYAWALGPSYETPSEIQDIILLGGNAVGMSTVPELMLAIELEMNVIGISCLTNYGAGLLDEKLTHEAIINITKERKDKFIMLIKKLVQIL